MLVERVNGGEDLGCVCEKSLKRKFQTGLGMWWGEK